MSAGVEITEEIKYLTGRLFGGVERVKSSGLQEFPTVPFDPQVVATSNMVNDKSGRELGRFGLEMHWGAPQWMSEWRGTIVVDTATECAKVEPVLLVAKILVSYFGDAEYLVMDGGGQLMTGQSTGESFRRYSPQIFGEGTDMDPLSMHTYKGTSRWENAIRVPFASSKILVPDTAKQFYRNQTLQRVFDWQGLAELVAAER